MAALSDITARSGVHLPEWELPNKPPADQSAWGRGEPERDPSKIPGPTNQAQFRKKKEKLEQLANRDERNYRERQYTMVREDPSADSKSKSGTPTDTERYPDNFEGPLPGPNQGGGRAKGDQSNSTTSDPLNSDMVAVLVGLGLALGAVWVL